MRLPIGRLILVFVATAWVASASLSVGVYIDTAPLIDHPAGPFSLEFQLIDGSESGDANNTAVLNAFAFGGGSPTGAPSVLGGVTGNLLSTITMIDSSPVNRYSQSFDAGTYVYFQVALTTNADRNRIPDEFSASILDRSGVAIPTADAPENAFVVIDGLEQTVEYSSLYVTQGPAAGGPPIHIPIPMVAATPEPGTFLISGVALCALALMRRRRTSLNARGR